MEIGSLLIAVLGALGVGGAVTQLVTWKLGGKKTSEVTATKELTGTALALVQTLDDQAQQARETAQHAQAEAETARRENRELRTELNQLRHQMDTFTATAADEARWATRARDALLAQDWPEGLKPTPPILAVVGTQRSGP